MAQTFDTKTMSGPPRMVQAQVTAWIESAAEKMPEEEYGFKPDPAMRSFGQLLGHIADANYLFVSNVLGEQNPAPGVEKNKTTKAELKTALHDAFAWCQKAYDELNDANAQETIKAFGKDQNRLGVLWFNIAHNLEHYGNLTVYLRIKGIVPPSSEPRPK